MDFVEEELLLCLNFDDKIDQNFFIRPKIFFNAVNLDSQRPLIQIDRHVFQGSYEDCNGTNIFLEEIPEPRSVDKVFQAPTPMHLEFLNSSAKTLNLKWINVPEEVQPLEESECIDIRFLEDYQTVLDKIENGTLDIQDAIVKTQAEKPSKVVKVLTEECVLEAEKPEELATEEKVVKETVASRDLLKRLIEPKTTQENPCEVLQDNLFNIENCDHFSILKQLYGNHLNKDNSFVKDITSNLAKADIFKLVDINKSIECGVVTEYDLSDEAKQALFNIKNFDNLSLPVKFIVLMDYLSDCKKQLQKLSEDSLKVVDEFNRTPKQRYKLLKSLARDIEYILIKHLTAQYDD